MRIKISGARYEPHATTTRIRTDAIKKRYNHKHIKNTKIFHHPFQDIISPNSNATKTPLPLHRPPIPQLPRPHSKLSYRRNFRPPLLDSGSKNDTSKRNRSCNRSDLSSRADRGAIETGT